MRKEALFTGLLIFLTLATAADSVPRVSAFFSRNGGCRDTLAQRLRSARKTLDIAIYSFSTKEIAVQVESAAMRGVKVRVVMDRSQAQPSYSVCRYLLQHGVPVRLAEFRGHRVQGTHYTSGGETRAD